MVPKGHWKWYHYRCLFVAWIAWKNCQKKNITKFVSKNARNDKIHISLVLEAGDFFPSIHGLLKLCQRRGHRLDLDFVRSRDDEFCLPICPKSSKQPKKRENSSVFLFCKKKMTTKKKAGKQKTTQTHKNLEMQSCLKKSRFMKKKNYRGAAQFGHFSRFQRVFDPFDCHGLQRDGGILESKYLSYAVSKGENALRQDWKNIL